MNVSIFSQKAYENKSNWTLGENKPNSNPNKPNCQKGKIDAKSVFTKDYRKKDDFAVRKNKPNSNPISETPKMSANVFVTKDYENETSFRPRKNKPNSKPITEKPKMNANAFSQKDYENKPSSGSKKTNPNKPNFETTLIGISQANRYLAKARVSGTKKAIGHFRSLKPMARTKIRY